MSEDRQTRRHALARQQYLEAQAAHRESVLGLERAAAELVTAGAALAERVRLTSSTEARPFPGAPSAGGRAQTPVRAPRTVAGAEGPCDHGEPTLFADLRH